MNTKIFRRFSYLLFLFLPSVVNASFWSAGKTLLTYGFIGSTFMTQRESAVDDEKSEISNASQKTKSKLRMAAADGLLRTNISFQSQPRHRCVVL